LTVHPWSQDVPMLRDRDAMPVANTLPYLGVFPRTQSVLLCVIEKYRFNILTVEHLHIAFVKHAHT